MLKLYEEVDMVEAWIREKVGGRLFECVDGGLCVRWGVVC